MLVLIHALEDSALELATLFARVPGPVDASLASLTVALIDKPILAAYERAFVAAKLTLGSAAGTGGGVGTTLLTIMCQ